MNYRTLKMNDTSLGCAISKKIILGYSILNEASSICLALKRSGLPSNEHVSAKKLKTLPSLTQEGLAQKTQKPVKFNSLFRLKTFWPVRL